VGESCPKHDVPLLDEPIVPWRRATDATESWITVGRYPFTSLAIAPRLRLEAEGIPTFLDGERVAAEVAYAVATGGVRLQVPASMAEQASEILGVGPDGENPLLRRPGTLGAARALASILAVLALAALIAASLATR
jgi:hypothetical protein